MALALARHPDIKDIDGIVARIQRDYPDFAIERKDIVGSLNAYAGKQASEKAAARTDLQKKLSAIKSEARGDLRLTSAIDALQRAIKTDTPLRPQERPEAKPSPKAIEALKTQLESLRGQHEAIKSKADVRDRIAELEQHLKAGTVPPKEATKPTSADLQALRDQRDELARQVKAADPAKRQAIRDQIDALQRHIDAGTQPPKDTTVKRAAPADIEALRKERDDLNKTLKQQALVPERADKLRAEIDALQAHLDAGTLPGELPRTPRPAQDARIEALEAAKAKVEAAIRESEPAVQAKYQKTIAKLVEKYQGLTHYPEPKPPKQQSGKVAELAYEAARQRQLINRRINALRPRTYWDRTKSIAAEPFHLMRQTLMTATSSVFRHGAQVATGHPLIAAKSAWAFVDAALAPVETGRRIGAAGKLALAGKAPELWTELKKIGTAYDAKVKTDAINQGLRNDPYVKTFERSGGFLSESRGEASSREEKGGSFLAQYIPGLAATERGYSTSLNVQRALHGKAMAKQTAAINRQIAKVLENHPRLRDALVDQANLKYFGALSDTLPQEGAPTTNESRAIAGFVNASSGHPVFDSAAVEKSAGLLNLVFFAPRYVYSRFQLALGSPLYAGKLQGTAGARSAIALEYARSLAGLAVIYGVAKAAGAQIGTDRNKSDFGKLTVRGHTIDFLGGMSQAIVFLSREISGEMTDTKTGVQHIPLSGPGVPFGSPTRTDLAQKFLQSKAAPQANLLMRAADQRNNPDKTPFAWRDTVGQAFNPLIVRDTYDEMIERGVPATTAEMMLRFLAVDVQKQAEGATGKQTRDKQRATNRAINKGQ